MRFVFVFFLACAGQSSEAKTASTASTTSVVSTLGTLTPRSARLRFESGMRDVLYFDAQHVALSADCAKKGGVFDCDAAKEIAKGAHVVLAAEAMGGANAGALVCRKLGRETVSGRTDGGDEDSFCIFPDGSLASNGSLEAHVLKP